MKVLYIKGTERKIIDYPRHDGGKIKGIDPDIKFYRIVENNKPSIDHRLYSYEMKEVLTDGDPIGVCERSYIPVKLDDESLSKNLNDSLGQYLDNNYPLWERDKHNMEMFMFLKKGDNLSQSDIERMDYIQNIFDWMIKCRSDRDVMENNLKNNGTLPSFLWDERPIKKLKTKKNDI